MIHAMPNLLWIDVLFSFDPHLQRHIDNWTSSIASVLLISQPRSVCEIPFFYIFSWPFKAPWKRVFFFRSEISNKTWWPEWPTRIRGNAGNESILSADGMSAYFFFLNDIHWFCRPGAFAKVFFWGFTKSLLNDLLCWKLAASPSQGFLVKTTLGSWNSWRFYSKSELSMVVQPILKRNLPFSYGFFLIRNPG